MASQSLEDTPDDPLKGKFQTEGSLGKTRTRWKYVIQRDALQILKILVDGDELGIREEKGVP